MPTGYTHDVQTGKLTNFRDFALRCARAMGACIMQRDDPMGDLPKHREPSDHHEKGLAKAQADLLRYSRMTREEAWAELEAEHDRKVLDAAASRQEKAIERQRYEAMLAKVNAWIPPSHEHENFKRFMVSQLTDSIKHDCYEVEIPAKPTVDEWLAEKIKDANWCIEYHSKGHAEEVARCAGTNQWIDALYASLPESD